MNTFVIILDVIVIAGLLCLLVYLIRFQISNYQDLRNEKLRYGNKKRR